MRLRYRIYTIVVLTLVAASCSVLAPFTAPDQDSVIADDAAEPGRAEDESSADQGGPATEDDATDTPTTAADAQSQPAQEPSPITIRTIASGNQSAVRVPVEAAIDSQSVFSDVWAAIHGNQLSPPPVPSINFQTETVIVLILGERPSAGYGVRATAARRRGGSIEITVDLSTPGPGTMNAAVLTSPYVICTIEVTGRPVKFVGEDIRAQYDPQ